MIRPAHGGNIVFGERDGRASERGAPFLEAGQKAGIRIVLPAEAALVWCP